MTKVSNPVVNIVKVPAEQTISNAPQRVLIVGQQTGSVYTSGQLVTDIGNRNEEINNFGIDSLISAMTRAFKAINEVTAIDAIPLDDDGGATDATGVITFTGTATAIGSLEVNVGSRVNHSYSLDISIGDTATDVAADLVAKITADTTSLVTAGNVAGVVTLTAVNGGTIANGIGLEVTGNVAGVTGVVTTAMSGGATDPVLTGLFDVVADTRYQTVIYPNQFDIATLTTNFLDPRFNVDNNILDGVGIVSKTDTVANLKTFLNAQNTQSLIVHSNLDVGEASYKGSAVFEVDDVISSEVGAIRSLRLTQDANISRFVISVNLDTRGGTHIASLPYFNTPFFNLPLVDIGRGFLTSEVDEINDAGGFVIGNNVSRTNVILDKVVTTYKTDVASNPDTTYKFLNTVDTHSNIAEFFFNNLRSDYAQYRLTDGAVIPGYNMANENSIRASFIEYYQTLSGPNFLLTRAGQSNVKFFSENLALTLDLQLGKVTSIAQVPLVVQLRELLVVLQAVFET